MWALKHPRVYRTSRGNRIAGFVIWSVAVASLAALFVYKGCHWSALLPGSYEPYAAYAPSVRPYMMMLDKWEHRTPNRMPSAGLRALWIVFLTSSVWLLFGRRSITISTENVVLRGFFGTTRIRQDDIAGRLRAWDRRRGSLDFIVSRSNPRLTIEVPPEIRRDTLFGMWFKALPELGAPD